MGRRRASPVDRGHARGHRTRSRGRAVTVHKAQGSQWPRLIVPVTDSRLLDRTLLYTAITRAQTQVLLVGKLKAARRAVLAPPKAHTRKVALDHALMGLEAQHYRASDHAILASASLVITSKHYPQNEVWGRSKGVNEASKFVLPTLRSDRSARKPFTHSHRTSYQHFLVWINVLNRLSLQNPRKTPLIQRGFFIFHGPPRPLRCQMRQRIPHWLAGNHDRTGERRIQIHDHINR
ncbi:helicase C-terminal domain-containing protein [Paraburkholderia sp. MPAMCS5]|uniref:helicase C-terminal domain-containing protein n=1 Tax=Paraburkholderia sp. MPAMCS5 TaxID=3112563 RepID=UPI002E16E693|nr:helicase C-terminal domain-containing protein [Paraburkholderia sp. MPAMCS5]